MFINGRNYYTFDSITLWFPQIVFKVTFFIKLDAMKHQANDKQIKNNHYAYSSVPKMALTMFSQAVLPFGGVR